ncbi:MAG: hypothetical protein M4579_003242 [Chaenotheca gracillima]|nr:MAG: hypothetical protein M4579_003242 [Chaenotheca gracillima]
MASPDNADDELFARLNALKQFNIARSTTRNPRSKLSGTDQDPDLSARFRKLANGAPVSPLPASHNPNTTGQFDSFGQHSTPFNVEDEKTVEELLAELGPDDQWKLDIESLAMENGGGEGGEMKRLLDEARVALASSKESEDTQKGTTETEDNAKREIQSPEKTSSEESKKFNFPVVEDEDEDTEHRDKKDDEEADEYLERILAELDVDSSRGAPDESDNETKEQTGASSDCEPKASPQRSREATPSFPEPPSTFLPISKDSKPAAGGDKSIQSADDLEARLAKLGLPSTPKSQPTITTRQAAKKKPTYTDEDVDSAGKRGILEKQQGLKRDGTVGKSGARGQEFETNEGHMKIHGPQQDVNVQLMFSNAY